MKIREVANLGGLWLAWLARLARRPALLAKLATHCKSSLLAFAHPAQPIAWDGTFTDQMKYTPYPHRNEYLARLAHQYWAAIKLALIYQAIINPLND